MACSHCRQLLVPVGHTDILACPACDLMAKWPARPVAGD